MKVFTFLIAGALCMAALSGCKINNPSEPFNDAMDGSGGLTAAETNNMGNVVEDLMSPSGTAKAAVETVTVEKIIIPWNYDQTNGYWTRSAEATYQTGTYVRLDTVWFKDAGGAAVKTPLVATVSTYKHVRSTTTKFTNTFDFRWEMNVAINKTPSDTVFVFNGSGTGAFNGDVFRSTTISNVNRRWIATSHPHLQFPSSGTIDMVRVLRTIDIVFTGNGNATATVTRKSDNKTVVFTIHVQTGAEVQ